MNQARSQGKGALAAIRAPNQIRLPKSRLSNFSAWHFQLAPHTD